MSRFAFINLSEMTPPDAVETLSFEDILEEMKADYLVRNPSYSVDVLESDPVIKALEVGAYRELGVRQRVNDAVRAVMLAFSKGKDLENLGAFYGVERKIIDPGDETATPPIAPTYESDDDYRRRIQLAPEAFTTAGSDGSYIFNALSAGNKPSDIDVQSPAPGTIIVTFTFDPDTSASKIKDASVTSPNPVEVVVTVLGHDGDGIVTDAILTEVTNHLSGKYVRPLTDQVTVQKASLLNFTVEATLTLYDGPDETVVLAEAGAKCWAYVRSQHVLGGEVNGSGLDAALHVGGVKRVTLNNWANKVANEAQAPHCTGITLNGQVFNG
jgi:phage-related baseplate assembly protein